MKLERYPLTWSNMTRMERAFLFMMIFMLLELAVLIVLEVTR